MTLRLPGRRRRRQPTAVLVTLVVSGLVAAALALAGLTAWWLRRRDDAAHVAGHTLEEAAFDATALDRAADEGMPLPPDGSSLPGPAPRGSQGLSNGADREAAISGGLVRLV